MSIALSSLATFIGIGTGFLAARSLIYQGSHYGSSSSAVLFLYPLVRLLSVLVIGWYVLHWGAVPFILFGGSTLITMWIVIITLR